MWVEHASKSFNESLFCVVEMSNNNSGNLYILCPHLSNIVGIFSLNIFSVDDNILIRWALREETQITNSLHSEISYTFREFMIVGYRWTCWNVMWNARIMFGWNIWNASSRKANFGKMESCKISVEILTRVSGNGWMTIKMRRERNLKNWREKKTIAMESRSHTQIRLLPVASEKRKIE